MQSSWSRYLHKFHIRKRVRRPHSPSPPQSSRSTAEPPSSPYISIFDTLPQLDRCRTCKPGPDWDLTETYPISQLDPNCTGCRVLITALTDSEHLIGSESTFTASYGVDRKDATIIVSLRGMKDGSDPQIEIFVGDGKSVKV